MQKLLNGLKWFFAGLVISVSMAGFAYDASKQVDDTNPLPHQTTDHYLTQQYLSPNGEVTAVPLYKLVGDVFTGTTIDPNFWAIDLGTGGSAVIAGGELTISTGATANNAVEITSIHTARFSGLAPNKVRIVAQLPDSGVSGNSRHWGIGTQSAGATINGAMFHQNGTAFELDTFKSSVKSVIANGAFNGQYGLTFTPGTTSHFYEIIYQPRQVVWLADNKIIHTLNAASTPWTADLNLPIHFGNKNTGISTDVPLKLRIATVARFGISETQPILYHIGGAGTFLLKNTPGNLRAITINSNTGTRIIVYDGLDATGGVIASINPNQLTTLDYKAGAFSTGLTVVTTGTGVDCTVEYE